MIALSWWQEEQLGGYCDSPNKRRWTGIQRSMAFHSLIYSICPPAIRSPIQPPTHPTQRRLCGSHYAEAQSVGKTGTVSRLHRAYMPVQETDIKWSITQLFNLCGDKCYEKCSKKAHHKRLWPNCRVGMVKESFFEKCPLSPSWSPGVQAIYYLTSLILNKNLRNFSFISQLRFCAVTLKYLLPKIPGRFNQTSRYCWEGRGGLRLNGAGWAEAKR